MAATVAYDELTDTRQHKAVTGGSRWNTYFLQSPKGSGLPQAFLVENTPQRVLRSHFHEVDQFQVIVSGDGTFGKHPVRPYTVHFARAHTPYGPITAGDNGIGWLTLRARRDTEGAQFVPERRVYLEQVAGRSPWQISEEPAFPDFDGDVSLQAVAGIHDDRGLGAWSLRLKPGATTTAPDSSMSDGQFLVVVRGSLIRDGREQRPLTIGYVEHSEGPFRVTAGAEGLDALVLNFPRPGAPIEAPALRAKTGLKVWRCQLCSFVYDEAKGMPEEGVPPGTRWEDVPETWSCPDCAASKADFDMVAD